MEYFTIFIYFYKDTEQIKGKRSLNAIEKHQIITSWKRSNWELRMITRYSGTG